MHCYYAYKCFWNSIHALLLKKIKDLFFTYFFPHQESKIPNITYFHRLYKGHEKKIQVEVLGNVFVISRMRPLPSVPVTIKTDVWCLSVRCLFKALRGCLVLVQLSHFKASHEKYKSFFKGMYSSANYNEFTDAVLFWVT